MRCSEAIMVTKYVSNGFQLGDDSWTGDHPVNVPPGTGPYKTSQHGVDELAKLTDPIKILNVYTYEYKENVRMHGKNYPGITVIGFRLGVFNPPIMVQFCEARPLVNGQQLGHVFDIRDATGVVLDSLNIANGKAGGCDGVAATKSQVDILNCCIHDNIDTGDGGGGFAYMDCSRGPSKVVNCYVYDNSSVSTGMGRGGGGMLRDSKDITISQNKFLRNKAEKRSGGGLTVIECDAIKITDHNVFEDNQSQVAASGVHRPDLRWGYGRGGAIQVETCHKAGAVEITVHNRLHTNPAEIHRGG